MRIARLAWMRIAAATTLCLALYAAPAMAQGFQINFKYGNWSEHHTAFTHWCYSQARSGHWGREASNDAWCKDNARFRNSHPDSDWQHAHPWDRGGYNDHAM